MPFPECPSTIAGLQQAFALGLVLGAAVFFVVGILVGVGWATAKTVMKKPAEDSQ